MSACPRAGGRPARASPTKHDALIHKVLLFAAWGQTGGGILVPIALLSLAVYALRRRRRRQPAAAEVTDEQAEHCETP